MSALEIAAVVVSLVAVWLTTRRAMLCWPLNLLACALYFKLFLDVRLYADMALQAGFGAGILYGWTSWSRSTDTGATIVVRALPGWQLVLGLAAGAIGGGAIGFLTSRYTDAALPWVDATLSSFSLVAQYWTARRHAENWLLWVAIDTLYVAMFLYKELRLTAGLYAAFTMIAILGYARWRNAHVAAVGMA